MIRKKIITITKSIRTAEIVAATTHDYQIIALKHDSTPHAIIAQHRDSACLVLEVSENTNVSINFITQCKETFATFQLPILALINDQKHINALITAGADDFVRLPIDQVDLKARLDLNVQRATRTHTQDSLTGLASTTTITHIITQRLAQPLAILYADIDFFKPYNDFYGFDRGDKLLCFAATAMREAVKQLGNTTDFIGRLGGDDFMIVTTPNTAEALAQKIGTLFDAGINQFYDHEDVLRKKITVPNRQKKLLDFPITSLSIGIVSNEKRPLTTIGQIAGIAAELKQYAKTKPGGAVASNYVKDRRTQ